MTDTGTTHIQPGQEYAICAAWPDQIRIRVKTVTDYGRAIIATLTDDGREVRPRRIDTRHLHPTGTTGGGQRRRTGYWLIRDVDATEAAAPTEEPTS